MRFILSLYSKAFANLDRNVWVLAVVMLVNRTGAMVLLFSSLYLTNELKFDLADAGLVMSLYGVGSILGSYAGGWLTDRYNHFDVMVGSLLFSGLFLPTILLVDQVWSVGLVIMTYSFLADIFRPAMSKGIVFYSSSENRTRSVSLIRLAVNLGFSLGPLMAGYIAFHIGYKPLYIIDGISSIVAALVVFMFIPRKTAESAQPVSDEAPRVKSAYRDWEFLIFVMLVAMYGICFFQLFASVPKYLDETFQYTEDTIGFVLFLNGILVVLIEMPLMAYLGNQRYYFRFIVAGVVMIPLSFGILIMSNGLLLVVCIYTLIITLSEIFSMPFMMNFSLSRPAKERQGQYAALYSIAYGISNMIAPTAGLGVADKLGFERMFQILIGLSFICAIGFYLLNRHLIKSNEFDKPHEPESAPVISNEGILDEIGPSEKSEPATPV